MRTNNKGYEIEDRMRRFFKGKVNGFDAVDFETSTTFYEVKSCNLFNHCVNGNHKRKFKTAQHKQIETFQHGRFLIIPCNHEEIKRLADEHNKKCKYIFAFNVGNQIIWKTKNWNEINVDLTKKQFYIPITKIFGDEINGK